MSSNGKRSRRKVEDCSVSTGRGSSESIMNDVARFEIGIAERIKGHKDRSHKEKSHKEKSHKEKSHNETNHKHRSHKDKSQNGHQDRKSNESIICEEPMAIDLSAGSEKRASKATIPDPMVTNDEPIVTNEKPIVPTDRESSDVTLLEPSASKPSSPGCPKKRSRKRSPSPVFTLRRDPTEPLKNFADCDTLYDGYVPSVDSGDIIEWTSGTKCRNDSGDSVSEITSSKDGRTNENCIKNPAGAVSGTKYNLLAARCKGCREQFTINNDSSLLKIYLDHCVKGCIEYRSLNLIKHCDPCNLYCIDRLAFLSHGRTNINCPMYDYFNFWSKRWNPGKKSS